MKRIIGLFGLQVLAVIVLNVSAFWAVISFIIYLVKDVAFDWMSVWVFIISCVVAVLSFIGNAINTRKHARKSLDEIRDMHKPLKKSKFQERLVVAAKQRKII